jgi:hypothetical protein
MQPYRIVIEALVKDVVDQAPLHSELPLVEHVLVS